MSNSTKEQKLKLLRQRFAKDLQAKITRIQNLWSDVQISRTEKRWADLNHCVHSLSGSAPTFGFNRLGVILKEIETIFRANNDFVFDQDQITQVNGLIDEAIDLANSGMDSPVCELSKQVVQQKKNEKPPSEFAKQKFKEAMELADKGMFREALDLLNRAKQTDPTVSAFQKTIKNLEDIVRIIES